MHPMIRYATAPVLATLLILGGCASQGGATSSSSGDKGAYETALAEASAAFKKSEGTRSAWSTADDDLKKAEEKAKEGDYEGAIKLAKKAKSHSDLAAVQGEEQAQAGPRYLD
jgi:hypothetical protein